jgi:hypothetical protein
VKEQSANLDAPAAIADRAEQARVLPTRGADPPATWRPLAPTVTAIEGRPAVVSAPSQREVRPRMPVGRQPVLPGAPAPRHVVRQRRDVTLLRRGRTALRLRDRAVQLGGKPARGRLQPGDPAIGPPM